MERAEEAIIKMPETKNSWDKQETETNRAYNAFLVYRNMGALRSLRKAAEIFYGEAYVVKTISKVTKRNQKYTKNTKKVSIFKKWSANNNWIARCNDWDIEEERTRTEQRRKDIRAMDIRQAKAGMKLSQIGVTNIELHASYNPPKDEAGNIIEPKISVVDSTRLFTEGIKAERIARGTVTEISEHKGEVGIKLIKINPEIAKKIGDELATQDTE